MLTRPRWLVATDTLHVLAFDLDPTGHDVLATLNSNAVAAAAAAAAALLLPQLARGGRGRRGSSLVYVRVR